MSNGESGSVLGTAIVGGSTATAGLLANTGATSTIAIIAGAAILMATLFVTFKGRKAESTDE